MGRRRAYDRDQIAAAALDVLDRDGPASLSMRAVADELGTGAMTLYNYVSDREELEALVIDVVAAEMRLPHPADPWQERVRAIGQSIATAVHAHPGVAPLMLTRRSTSPAALLPAEALLDALTDAGLSGHARLVAFRTLLAVVMGIVQADVAGPLSHVHGQDPRDRFAALDPNEFPHLVALAKDARTSSLDQEIQSALTLVIDAIQQGSPTAPRRGSSRRPTR